MSRARLREFVIPLEKDDLLVCRDDAYSVQDIVPLNAITKAIDETRMHFQEEGTEFILNQFDTFFSVLLHSNKIEFPVTLRAFNRLHKALNHLIEEMEPLFEDGADISVDKKPKYRCMNKMYAYLLSSMAIYLEDCAMSNANSSDNIGKKKKAVKKSNIEEEWEPCRQKVLESMYRWFLLPLQKLWTPPIVEDMFISNLIRFCYKILEQSKDAKEKYLRETIFEILGILVKRYNQGFTCVLRIIQLVQMCDPLAVPLATGVVHMIEETGCKSFIRELVREIGQKEPGESEARNIATFLEALATSNSELVLPVIDDITEYLANECYTMRNGVIGVLGAVVQGCLTGENIDDERRHQRDECLQNLLEHICDNNAYVRSKALQVWQRLCCAGAVPLQRQNSLIKVVTMRLDDKSAQVRKQALQLLRALAQCNPFAAKFDEEELSKQLEEESAKLNELRVAVVKSSTRGDVNRLELWNFLLPKIRLAISEVMSNESENDNSSDNEDEEPEENGEIDAEADFEKIRHLLLTEEVTDAVEHLRSIFQRLPDAPNLHSMKQNAKENCFLLCLQKIFEESEAHPEPQPGESGETSEGLAASADEEHSARIKDLKKHKEELAARRKIVDYVENCLGFARELEVAVPQAENLMFSTTNSVAIEACSFLGTASQFGVKSAVNSVRKALLQVHSQDSSVRNNVARVYKEIYLTKVHDNQSERQQALMSVKCLMELLEGTETDQSKALGHLIETWRANGDIGSQEFQVMWEKFSMKIPDTSPKESRAALVLLTMAAETQPSLLVDNLDVLIKVGLGPRARDDLLLARDTCRALLKIRRDPVDPLKPPLRYPNDHVMFQEIVSLLVEGCVDTADTRYISFAADAINAIYHLANCPSVLSKEALSRVAKKINLTKQKVSEQAEEARRSFGSQISPSQGSNSQIPASQSSNSQIPASQSSNSQIPASQGGGASQIPSSREIGEIDVQDLTRLLHITGHTAVRELVHLDSVVYKELKRRNTLREMKKGNNASKTPISTPASAQRVLQNKKAHNISVTAEENSEEALVGATADDADVDLITNTLETEIVTGKGLVAQFVPLVLDVCRHPEKYNDELLQTAGVLALSKMMIVSSTFCVAHLQLLVTIMERSPYPGIRANVFLALSDLITRFPNKIEPWTGFLYDRLRDKNVHTRRTCVNVLANLIMREMIRVKSQASNLALCIIDPDETIRTLTKQFFKDLSQKGNILYNVMPDILSHLMDPELNLEEKDFQEVIKYLFGLQNKEQRQVDMLIGRLCSRLKLVTAERQCCDLAYCLSLLPYTGKSIVQLTDCVPQLKDKLHNKQVLKYLQTIIETTKKKPDAKTACIELEQKIEKLLDPTESEANEVDDRIAMPPPAPPKRKKKSRRAAARQDSSSDEENDEDDEDDVERENIQPRSAKKSETPRSTPKKVGKRKKPTDPTTPLATTSRLKRNKLLEATTSPSPPEEITPRRSARSRKRL